MTRYDKLHCFSLAMAAGILVTGGQWAGGVTAAAELLTQEGRWWCELPPLSRPRYLHSQTGLVTCGGQDTRASYEGLQSIHNHGEGPCHYTTISRCEIGLAKHRS